MTTALDVLALLLVAAGVGVLVAGLAGMWRPVAAAGGGILAAGLALTGASVLLVLARRRGEGS